MRYSRIVQSNLNLLASFQMLIEERSVTRAATRMCISQPAMSRVLDRLQEMFGDKLVVRTRKGFEPTRRALQIYNQLEQALPTIEEVLRGREFNPSKSTDTFRIAMTDHVALTLLPTLMKAIELQAPRVRIEIFAWDDTAFRRLETNALDVGVWCSDPPPHLHSETIYRDKFVCVIRKGHPLGNQPLTAKRYLQLEHLIISHGIQQGSLETTLTRLGYHRKARLRIPFFTAAASIIEITDMAATLPSRLAERFAANFRTQAVSLSFKLPDMHFSQVWHPRNDQDPAHIWLRQLIRRKSREGYDGPRTTVSQEEPIRSLVAS